MAITLSASVREKLVKKILVGLRNNVVFGGITDGQFVSGLPFGEDYKIPIIDDTNIITYTGADMERQAAGDTLISLPIDQGKAFNVWVNGLDASQAEAKIGDYIENGIYGLSSAFDTFLGSTTASGAGVSGAAYGITGAPIGIDESNVLDWIKAMANGIAANGADLNMSSIVVPFHVSMSLTNALGGHSQRNADDQRKGFIDTIYGVDVYSSNNLPAGATTYDVLNETGIPLAAPIEINQAVTGVASGTAILGDGTVIGVQTVLGTLYVNDTTDTGLAEAADASASASRQAVCFEKRAVVWRDSAIAPIVSTPDNNFGDQAKSLHMYGGVVTLPNAVAVGFVTEA